MAHSLLLDGWNVVGIDWNEESSNDAMEELGFTIYQGDVSNYSDVASAFAKTWRQYKRLDFGKMLLDGERLTQLTLKKYSQTPEWSRAAPSTMSKMRLN